MTDNGKPRFQLHEPRKRTGADPGGYSDDANATHFIDACSDHVRFCVDSATWLVWDGARWTWDPKAVHVIRRAREFATAFVRSASMEDFRKALGMLSRKSIDAFVHLSRSDGRVWIDFGDIDSHPHLLNVENGTVDLRTGELKPHDPADLLTHLVPVRYNPRAACPRWKRTVSEVMGGDTSMIRYLQRVLGYATTGENREQAFFVAHGPAGTGKSTLFDTVRSALGSDVAIEASHDLLLQDRRDAHPTAFTDLRGRRLVKLTEVDEGRRLAVDVINKLTGDSKFRARGMRENNIEFNTTAKLFVLCNDRPRVSASKEAVWQRVQCIPFPVKFRGTQREDKKLHDRLAAEREGILAWLVRGARRWYQRNLDVPAAVRKANRAWRKEEDVVGRFIKECCATGNGRRESVRDLHQSFVMWSDETGDVPRNSRIGERAFARELDRLGYRSHRTNKGAIRLGIALRSGK